MILLDNCLQIGKTLLFLLQWYGKKAKPVFYGLGCWMMYLFAKKTAQSSRLKKVACKWWWKWASGAFRGCCKKIAIAHIYPLRYKLRKRISIWHGVLKLQTWLDNLILFVSRWATLTSLPLVVQKFIFFWL